MRGASEQKEGEGGETFVGRSWLAKKKRGEKTRNRFSAFRAQLPPYKFDSLDKIRVSPKGKAEHSKKGDETRHSSGSLPPSSSLSPGCAGVQLTASVSPTRGVARHLRGDVCCGFCLASRAAVKAAIFPQQHGAERKKEGGGPITGEPMASPA
ncbi:hypothetical protein H105_08550 [Trichophyton soudanense CBS 452.61]|uniref:Uncharacterized protein n=1 Tax=Trichophyton soudanense CBS 452.61 TaxID=1215331 RepID=A0A022XFC1_TRISD|nr:hypothetical protein H105_08550 [Trichophyton soudanense CBS 452.61]EZG01068.1 hypothetical protein H106_08421 [Trichophyton rubrum CBS 735.88]